MTSAAFTGTIILPAVFLPSSSISGLPSPPGPLAPRRSRQCAVVGSKVYVVGGADGFFASLSSMEIFDTETQNWTAGPAMMTKRYLHSVAVRGSFRSAYVRRDCTNVCFAECSWYVLRRAVFVGI